MSDVNERLDSLRGLIQSPEFLEGKGLSNEVNIHIFCYDPKDEMAVRHFTEKLVTDQSLSCHLIEYNLYKVFLSICDDKRITERIPAQEEKKGKRHVLTSVLRERTSVPSLRCPTICAVWDMTLQVVRAILHRLPVTERFIRTPVPFSSLKICMER